MDTTTIARYQPGGDIYATILSQHGAAAAAQIAAAAQTGDETQINAVLAQYVGTLTPDVAVPLSTDTTASDFLNQIATDPLAAPLASANTLLGNTFLSFLKNPWVVLTIAAVVFFGLFDGVNLIRGWTKGKP